MGKLTWMHGEADVNGVKIAYEVTGLQHSEPLLLVMGLSCQLIHWPEALCEQLVDRGFRVIRFDNRDVGRSTHFDDAPPPRPAELLRRRIARPAYTLNDMADDAAGLLDALGRAGVAEIDGSGLARALYSSDGSLYRVLPRAVVRPRDADEVVATLAVCRALGVPLTMRGAGTSIAGNAVGPGVVVDTSRHLARVRSVDAGARAAVVEPGVVQAALQAAARPAGVACLPPASIRPCTTPLARPSFSASIAATPPAERPFCLCRPASSAVARAPAASSRRATISARPTASTSTSAS